MRKEVDEMRKKKLKIPVIIAIVLALFLPTYAAVISYFAIISRPALMSSGNYKISVIQPDGSDMQIDDSDSSDLINLFRSMKRDASKSVSGDTSDCYAYSVTLSDGSRTETTCFLFSPAGKGYIKDGTGDLLEVPQRYTDLFLSGKYACLLYNNSAMPVMTFSGFAVMPERAEWSYSGYMGQKVSLNVPVTGDVLNYGNASEPSISFSVPPVSCSVTVYSGEDVLTKDATLGDFASLAKLLTGNYTYYVKAAWHQGSAEYRFTSSPIGKASFSLVGSGSAESGGYAIISGTGVLSPDDVGVKVSPDIGVKPAFFANGGSVCAIIPFGLGIFDTSNGSGESREYIITVTYGGSSTTFRVGLKEAVYQKKDLNHTGTAVMNGETLGNTKSLIASVCASDEKTVRFSGSFLKYEDIGFTFSPGFGRIRILPDSSEIVQQGVQYRSEKTGLSVPAANAGKVVRVGNDTLLGKFAVIDHGLGIKTWYCHLSECVVAEGTSVTKGETVGRTGSSGYTDTTGFFFITTVRGMPVSPYAMQENGIPSAKSGG